MKAKNLHGSWPNLIQAKLGDNGDNGQACLQASQLKVNSRVNWLLRQSSGHPVTVVIEL